MRQSLRTKARDSVLRFIGEFYIPDLPPTVNVMMSWHWAKKHKHARIWKNAVIMECMSRDICHLNLNKASLTLTRHSSREIDADNLAGSWKWVLDGLVEAGVIVDDKPSIIGSPIFQWQKAKPMMGGVNIRIDAPDLLHR